MKKKVLALCLAVCLAVSGGITASAEEGRFTDLDTCASWKREAAEWAGDLGYFQGDGQGRFLPDEPLTRAMFVTVLYRMSGESEPEDGVRQDIFGEVPRHAYYWDPALWAGVTGIAAGIPDGPGHSLFRPEGLITREQAAVMLYRWAQMQEGLDVRNFNTLYQFEDRKTVSSWAREAMEWAVGIRAVQGTKEPTAGEKGELSPWGYVTRAEAAAMLKRLWEEIDFQNTPEPDPFQEPGRYVNACGGGERTLGELMDESTLVVTGTVTESTDCFLYRSGHSYSIFRDFTLVPQETLRGEEAAEPVKLRVEGGSYGNWGVSVTSEASLEVGKEYLLFLAPRGERNGPYQVLGYLGAYEKAGGEEIYRNVQGEELSLPVIRQKLELFNLTEPVW